MEIEPFVHSLPKIELHIHIEGTLSPSLRWRLAQRNNIILPYSTLEELKASYGTLAEHRKQNDSTKGQPSPFFELYYGGMEVLQTETDFYELCMEFFTRLSEMNVRYVEPFLDIQAHTRRGVRVATVMTALQRATEDANTKHDIACNWTLCFLRDMSVEAAQETYETVAPYRGIVFKAIGLDSNEYNRPPTLFESVFRQARRDALRVTAHCDVNQKDTHKHIRQVASEICGTGLDRIDHGLNAAEDPELIQLIQHKRLGMTLSPHAYQRRRPPDWVFPRVRTLFDAGIPVTINSDGPALMQDMWVEENLQLVRSYCPFSDEEMIRLQRNAVDICWAEEEVKQKLRKELDEFAVAHGLSTSAS